MKTKEQIETSADKISDAIIQIAEQLGCTELSVLESLSKGLHDRDWLESDEPKQIMEEVTANIDESMGVAPMLLKDYNPDSEMYRIETMRRLKASRMFQINQSMGRLDRK